MRCLSCKYDLSQLAEHRCPECGRAFDPTNPKTFDVSIRQSYLAIVALVIFILLVIVGWVAWITYLWATSNADVAGQY